MSDQAERVAVACPACSPNEAALHAVLRPGATATVRCGECGHVHKAEPPRTATQEKDVVVSQDGESFSATVEVPEEETVRVGEEFVLETDEAILGVRITDLQLGPEERVEAAKAGDVDTFWTRAVDNVYVDVTIHPSDGRREDTESVKLGVPGDHEFEVGGVEEHGDHRFKVDGVHVRADAVGYPASKLDQAGDAVAAKDAKRVLATEEGTTSGWSAW